MYLQISITSCTFLDTRLVTQTSLAEVFIIINYQRNANQNYKEISAHTNQKSHHESLQTIMLERLCRKEPSYIVGGKLEHCYRKHLWKFLKKLKIELLYDLAIPFPGIYPEKAIFEKIHAPQCSLQHYLQQPRNGSNLNVH